MELLLELGCEELPERFLQSISNQLKHDLTKMLTETSVSFGSIEGYSTPRRLIIYVKEVAGSQPEKSELITGPPYSACFDGSGNPTRALEGFARKREVSVQDLSRIETEKGTYLGYEKIVPGQKTANVLEEMIPKTIKQLDLPKTMKWESSRYPFLRPIRWVLCLLDGQILPIKIASVDASDYTFGHRILSGNSKKSVGSFVEFREWLLASYVEISPVVRRQRIEGQLHAVAKEHCGILVEDVCLLDMLSQLSENPTVVCGSFESSFLKLPREVLITVMREHQKYFSVHDAQGKILPIFLAVVDSNQIYLENIRAGHERVLRARLADAAFFWEVDSKILLESRVGQLEKIVYQVELGSVYNKVHRINRLARILTRMFRQSELLPQVELAVRLCKSDLTTEMVKEFSNLQGVMGGLYALEQGVDATVAEAIYDHYLPVSFEDQLPRSIIGSIISLSDKLDTLVGAFCVGLVPTGSRDPLGLRRQAIAVIRILLANQLTFSFQKVLQSAYQGLKKVSVRSLEEIQMDANIFLKDRLRFIFKGQGFSYDEINSILEICWDNPLECNLRLKAISSRRNSSDFQSLAISFKRIKNILLKAEVCVRDENIVDTRLFETAEEENLYRAVISLTPQLSKSLRVGHHEVALELMASMKSLIDAFFDKVLVMANDEAIRRNRLALLTLLLRAFLQVADISEIVRN